MLNSEGGKYPGKKIEVKPRSFLKRVLHGRYTQDDNKPLDVMLNEVKHLGCKKALFHEVRKGRLIRQAYLIIKNRFIQKNFSIWICGFDSIKKTG